MNLIFFGTPAFALPNLERILRSRHRVLAVVTQPSRPKGRLPSTPQPPPVYALAASRGIPVLQPERPEQPDFLQQIGSLHADCGVVVAYGALLPRPLLDLFPQGVLNLHASLLPKLRGAAPIQWALIRGEPKTGVTAFRLDEQLDHGPILLQAECPIQPEEDAVSLGARLADLGAGVLEEALNCLEQGTIHPVAQEDAQATTAPRLKKEDGILDWTQDCQGLHNRVRGVQPWPGAVTRWGSASIKILRTRPDPERHTPGASPGLVICSDPREGLCVQTGRGGLWILQLQLEGGKPMGASEFLRGHPLSPDTRLAP